MTRAEEYDRTLYEARSLATRILVTTYPSPDVAKLARLVLWLAEEQP